VAGPGRPWKIKYAKRGSQAGSRTAEAGRLGGADRLTDICGFRNSDCFAKKPPGHDCLRLAGRRRSGRGCAKRGFCAQQRRAAAVEPPGTGGLKGAQACPIARAYGPAETVGIDRSRALPVACVILLAQPFGRAIFDRRSGGRRPPWKFCSPEFLPRRRVPSPGAGKAIFAVGRGRSRPVVLNRSFLGHIGKVLIEEGRVETLPARLPGLERRLARAAVAGR